MTTQFIEKFIDDLMKPYNTDEIVDKFYSKIKTLTIDEVTDIVLSDIYIPDYYRHDSSEETLFTKLVEVTTSFVFEKLGIKSEYLKTKSATEDIHLIFNEKEEPLHVVGDVKTYRLGRSQKAANVKDFVKPADFKEIWGKKYENSCGLVVFPSTHEWSSKSDVYQHCTNPDYPIVMMHYSHLAVLLNNVENRNLGINFESLWDYSDLRQSEINSKDKNNY
ncbi:TPA: HindIII family type II restriction endonuclease, partial [Staphylococcus pseudintermedius]|nr:HindIII family type II restriction endonuclease [Staphylococcus pseudintermedius]